MIDVDKIQVGDTVVSDGTISTYTKGTKHKVVEDGALGEYWVNENSVEIGELTFAKGNLTLVATNTKYSDIDEGDTVEIACLSDEQIARWTTSQYLIGLQGEVIHKSKSIHVEIDGEEWCLQPENLRVVEKATKENVIKFDSCSSVSFDPALDKRKNGKIKTELLETGFPNAMMALAEVMTWAADYKGYQPNDWKDIPDAKNSLLAAACRHRLKRLKGEDFDDESGLHHLYHEAFNVMAQLELLITGKLK